MELLVRRRELARAADGGVKELGGVGRGENEGDVELSY